MPTTSNFGWTTPADTDLVKDGAAAIRTLGNGIDTSFLDLKGGTTDQVLAKNSNSDLDFKWVAQDDSNAIQNAIVDAKGDLISATAADTPARLAVGANDTVLTADSTTATGLKWAAVAGGSLNYQLLNAGGTNLTAASTITVSFSAQKALLIFVEDGSTTGVAEAIQLRFNSDTGTNYTYAYLWRQAGSPALIGQDYNTQSFFQFATQGSSAANTFSGILTVFGADSAGIKPVQYNSYATGTADARAHSGNGFYKGTSAITSVSLLGGSNFDAGKIYVYGAA